MDTSTGIPVSIQLQTKVTQGGEHKDFLFDLTGQVVSIGDTLYIRYKEVQEDSLEEVPVTVKLTPDGRVQIIRAGGMRMRLRFGYGERLESTYRTPHGTFQIATQTSDLHVSLKDQPVSGSIRMHYQLYSMDEKVGDYQLQLEFTA
jgi:uncharacterized beta-barrel protein YwiB (DUF1934 family)